MKPIRDKIKKILKESFKESVRLNGREITPDHIVITILNDGNNRVITTFEYMGFDTEELSSKIEAYLRLKITNPNDKITLLPLSQSSKMVLNISEMESDKIGDDDISEEHLMLSILKNKELDCTKVLNNQGIYYINFKSKLLEIKKQVKMSMTEDFDEVSGIRKKTNTKSTTPILDNFGRDITELASKGVIDPIIGREDEIERVSQILSRRKKNNPILIGEPGCVLGDTKIVVKKISELSTHTFIDK